MAKKKMARKAPRKTGKPKAARKSPPTRTHQRKASWRIVPLTSIIEGNTLIVTSAGELGSLPSPYNRVLTKEHRVALANPPAYFRGLATKCNLPGMKRWLNWLSLAERWELHLSVAEFGLTEAGILPIWDGRPRGLLVRLRQLTPEASYPRKLRKVFDLIAGTYDEPFASGGVKYGVTDLTRGDELRSPVLVRDPSSVTYCFMDAAGDMLLAEGHRGIWHLHETNAFVDAGPLLSVVDGYFRWMVDNTPWFVDLYDLWRRQNPGRSDC